MHSCKRAFRSPTPVICELAVAAAVLLAPDAARAVDECGAPSGRPFTAACSASACAAGILYVNRDGLGRTSFPGLAKNMTFHGLAAIAPNIRKGVRFLRLYGVCEPAIGGQVRARRVRTAASRPKSEWLSTRATPCNPDRRARRTHKPLRYNEIPKNSSVSPQPARRNIERAPPQGQTADPKPNRDNSCLLQGSHAGNHSTRRSDRFG